MEKDTKKKKENIFKKFELDTTNMRGLLRTIRVVAVLVVLIIFIKLIFSLSFNKVVNYPLIYRKSGTNLVLIDKKDNKKNLSKDSNTTDVLYANKTDKYVLFKKNTSLYLFDSRKDEIKKIASDVKRYYFSTNDKYIVYTVTEDSEDHLYVYNYKDNEKIVSDIDSIKLVTDKDVVFIKNGILYLRSLNYKKEEIVRIDKNFSKDITLLDKNLVYIDRDKKLIKYDINTKKSTNIDSDVNTYYSDEDVDAIYYLTLDNTLYYYDGNKSTKITNDIFSIAAIDLKNQEVVYTKKDGKKYDLYFQKSSKEPSVIERNVSSNIDYAFIYEKDCVYYINKDNDLMYTRISGSKTSKSRSVVTDVEPSTFHRVRKGFVFIADASKKGLGTLYLTNAYKAKKIDTEVIGTNIKVSNDGKKFYYLKNYGNYVGDLYVSNGGNPTEIDKDVYKYQYINDKLMYYIKDYSMSKKYGDLYRYTRKSVKIDDEVGSMTNIHNEYKK